MTTSDKRARAYDYVAELVESAPKMAAKALLSVLFNHLSADDFIDVVGREFEWEDVEGDTDAEDDDDFDVED